ncbi:phenylalanine--tRNA ligase subunit beta [Blattabacterium cuenoti]|uniref:phenylalanine--tRNA ligase subunit beta n=1 Tax=Blattabacterium cuenoti TaxID=1653831 RepID=UPI00163CBB6A|nr:phenylalanine--tRNA ligase subunit beta [Blattabacterium cuenoti]
MIISYNWIKEYISTDFNVNQISNTLSDIGLPVKNIKKIFHNEMKDYILDVEITPNRTDAMSHYGIARDLYAVLKFRGNKVLLSKPPIISDDEKIYNSNIDYFNIKIFEKNKYFIKRYSGMSIFQVKIDNSPDWLIFRLKSIGIKTINNIIDITNFVSNELGLPIHVFDLDKIKGNKILIKNSNKDNIFHLKENVKKKLNLENFFVIYDEKKPLSIAGIIPDNRSIVNKNTKNIFLGIACFDFSVNHSIKKYLNIDKQSQNIFEKRKIEPYQSLFALNRTSFLINQIINTKKIFSKIIDFYPTPNKPLIIKLRYKRIKNILGNSISKNKIKKILSLLEITIKSEDHKCLSVIVPIYRTDVHREIDLIEEILRIYGVNKIKIPNKVKISPLPNFFHKTEWNIQKILIGKLISYGFKEIISSTMRNMDKYSLLLNYFMKIKEISVINPINKNSKFLRNSLLFGMIDSVSYNYDRGINNIKFFEIGKIYYKKNGKLFEKKKLGILISKKYHIENENFFYLKGIIEQIFQKSGIINYTQKYSNHPLLKNGISILYNNKNLVELGKLKKIIGKNNHILFYAEIDWEYLISIIQEVNVIFFPLSIYPSSKRDLSFIVNDKISFEEINQLIKNQKDKLIKKIRIYDFYQGKNIPNSKKSYTINFLFESEKKTLSNEEIRSSMKKIENTLIEKLDAEIRNK